MTNRVFVTRVAKKQLRRMPGYIIENLARWIEQVENQGLQSVRKIPGFHDEPLQGKRTGQRSIRLSKAYRAIYVITENLSIRFVSIEEVSKHDY